MPVIVPISVTAEVITSLPGSTARAPSAMCTAAVPDEQPLANLTPYIDFIMDSICLTLVPKT